jgi:hypothetical protein
MCILTDDTEDVKIFPSAKSSTVALMFHCKQKFHYWSTLWVFSFSCSSQLQGCEHFGTTCIKGSYFVLITSCIFVELVVLFLGLLCSQFHS